MYHGNGDTASFLGDVENRVVRSDDETLLLSMADVLMVLTGHIVRPMDNVTTIFCTFEGQASLPTIPFCLANLNIPQNSIPSIENGKKKWRIFFNELLGSHNL